jgi:penicillin-binding protein 1A
VADKKPIKKPKIPLRIEKVGPLRRRLLDLDARLGHTFFTLGVRARARWDRFSGFMDRFHVAGTKRFLVELFSEGFTLGTAGAILMLALATPAFRETTDEDWLKKTELSVVFLDRYGTRIGDRGTRINDTVPLEEFPDHLIKAVLATEDRRFYEHFGIDFPGTLRAIGANARAGGVVQGGSSITQQLAKNLFLNNERTLERKVKEAFLAVWLETRLTKKEILKLYLDRAYLGGGSFGVDAAAQYYFNKSVRDVTLSESAMLAGLFKAPTRFAPHVNLAAARARANTVLDNLVEAGMMTEGQVYGARRNPAKTVDRRDEEAPNYYLDYAFREVQGIVDTLPPSVSERVFVVRTGLDINIQRAMDVALNESLRQFGRDYNVTQGAMVLMEPNGVIRAMTGGRDYGESQFNRATDSLRQPGSSFKPYTYATALMNGFKPTSVVVDSPVCIGNWCPRNYSGGYSGAVTLTQAITNSINIIPVKLSIALGNGNAKIGRAKIIETARKMGIRGPLPDTPSLPLGADGVVLLEHTAAFATFPNGGKAVERHAVIDMRTAAGQLVWNFERDGKKPVQVLPPQVAADMVMMMNNAVENGTGRRAQLDGIKTAGKTGTTSAWRDAWFMGYTGNFVCGIWLGNDDYTPTRNMTGGTLPALTWHKVMAYAHQGVEIKPLYGLKGAPGPRLEETPVAGGPNFIEAPRPMTLPQRTSERLMQLEKIMRDAGAPTSALPDERWRAGRALAAPASDSDQFIRGN